MNLDQAEQWANNWATDTTSIHNPLTPLMTEYHRRGQELERLTAVIARYETGAQAILDAIAPEVNR